MLWVAEDEKSCLRSLLFLRKMEPLGSAGFFAVLGLSGIGGDTWPDANAEL